ncbi:MAG: ParB/RepB/Spo0J family partition protein [Patescibacteria group bacterium]
MLGRGLSSLIPPKPTPAPDGAASFQVQEVGGADALRLMQLPPEMIDPNPYQPRDTFPHGTMEDLVNSIRAHGILEPLLATRKPDGRYELISGERRLRAAKFLELKIVPVIIRRAEDIEKLELALIENLQRQDLNAIEEAEGFRELADTFNLTQEELARRVGKSREVVANTLRLLSLPGEVQAAIAAGKITATHGRLLLQVADATERQKLFEQILREGLTLKEAEMRGRGKIKKRSGRSVVIADAKMAGFENSLRESLGTKVSIDKRGKTGKIVIEFYSEEELESLVKQLQS